jgi:chromosome partitioning protein
MPDDRSYFAKYPGQVGTAVRAFTDELLARLAASPQQSKQTEPPPMPAAVGSEATPAV